MGELKKNYTTEETEKLLEKTKEYAWYVAMWREEDRAFAAERILEAKKSDGKGCDNCGIPFGLPHIQIRALNTLSGKAYVCPKCFAELLEKIKGAKKK